MNDQILTAFIGAGSSIAVLLFRDVLLRFFFEKLERKKNYLYVFNKYSGSIAQACTSFLWRFHEIFHTERSSYLIGEHPKYSFERYKRISTLYRLAALLGWIQAFGRELSLLRGHDLSIKSSFVDAIHQFQSALADGPHVEVEVTKRVAEQWELKLPRSEKELISLSIAATQVTNRCLYRLEKRFPDELSKTQQIQFCRELADFICQKTGYPMISDALIKKTAPSVIRAVSIRQAWIYRDWQSAIGDIMIREGDYGERRFDLISYSDFEKMYLDPENVWMKRLNNLIYDLNIGDTERFDARGPQLRQAMVSVAHIVITMSQVNHRSSLFDSETLKLARSLAD